MKEIDFKTLQQLIEGELHALNIRYLVAFILLNMIVVLVNWLIQRNVKSQEKEIYKKKVREDRRITVMEEIYKTLVSFTYIFTKEEMQTKLSVLSDLEKDISINRLYIDTSMNSKITLYLDYIKEVMADFRKKDFKRESALLDNVVKEFNK